MRQSAIDEILNRPLSKELLARDLTRLAFVALDGTPRSMALRRNPAVALTIDTETHPRRE